MSDKSNIPPELPQPISIRSDLVNTAVNFLKDPQVQAAPLSKRLAFLEGKGLTAEEIDLALIKVNDGQQSQVTANLNSHTSPINLTNSTNPSNIKSQTNSSSSGYKGLILTTAVILGTGSLLISNYESIKSFAKKIIFRSENEDIKRVEAELRQSIKELKDIIEEKERLLQEALKTKVIE